MYIVRALFLPLFICSQQMIFFFHFYQPVFPYVRLTQFNLYGENGKQIHVNALNIVIHINAHNYARTVPILYIRVSE